MRTQTTRTVSGRVYSDGSPASGGEFTSRRTALGQYMITVTPGLRLVAASASALGFAVCQVGAVAPSIAGQSFSVTTGVPNTGTGIDTGFHFVATVAT